MASNTVDLGALEAKIDYHAMRDVVGGSISMTLLATIFVVSHVVIRRIQGRDLAAESWMFLACLPLLYGVMATALLAVYIGGLGVPTALNLIRSPQIILNALACRFAVEVVYISLITLIKLSILVLYRGLFPTKLIINGTKVVGALALSWWLAIYLLIFLQCKPLERMWNIFVTQGYCLNSFKTFIGNAIPNIVIDILILVLPIFEVSRLQLSLVKKVSVTAVILLGGLVVVMSGLRFRAGIILLTDPHVDYTAAIGPIWVWTVVEPAMGLICACLPTVGPFFVMQFRLALRTRLGSRGDSKENSSGKRGSAKAIITIGGGLVGGSERGLGRSARYGSTASKKMKSNPKNSSFELLHDDNSPPQRDSFLGGLWPVGYTVDRETAVSGKRTPSERDADIPLTSISYRQELNWAENKEGEKAEPTKSG